MTTQPTNESGERPPMTKDDEQIPVTQEDRDAARPWLHQYLNGSDRLALAEAFARHRLAARPSTDVLVEALEEDTLPFLREVQAANVLMGETWRQLLGHQIASLDQALTTYRETGT